MSGRRRIGKADARSRAWPGIQAISLLALVAGLCACDLTPKKPIDPSTVRSVLTIQRGTPGGSAMTVNGEPVSWDENGAYVIDTESGGDYAIELIAAPQGTAFSGFLVSIDDYYLVAETVQANPLRVHVEKNTVFVRPCFSTEAQASLSRVAGRGSGGLPAGIILP
jgi:hypothetical protein